jgi:hypothetical protein
MRGLISRVSVVLCFCSLVERSEVREFLFDFRCVRFGGFSELWCVNLARLL